MFSLYVNDLESVFLNSGCDSYHIGMLNLYSLMYADDTVLVSAAGLQSLLDTLDDYSTLWNLVVNVNKTKILVFRKSVRLMDYHWYYQGQQIEIVNKFCYLGITLNYTGKHLLTQQILASQGRKALAAMYSRIRN